MLSSEKLVYFPPGSDPATWCSVCTELQVQCIKLLLLLQLTCRMEVTTDLVFHEKKLLHLSVSNWVNFVCTQGLLVLLPLYHSGIVLRVPRVCSLIDPCVYPPSSHISVFSANFLQAMPTKEKNPPALSSQALVQAPENPAFYLLFQAGTSWLIAFCIEQYLLPITATVGALKLMIVCCWNTNWSLETLIMAAWLYN